MVLSAPADSCGSLAGDDLRASSRSPYRFLILIAMADIRIDASTTTDDIRRQLSDFRRFSKVEARAESGPAGDIIILHEVTLGERLKRPLAACFRMEGSSRANAAKESRAAMDKLVASRPALQGLLGASIRQKAEWRPTKLHAALSAKLVSLKPAEHGQWAVEGIGACQIGVANQRSDAIVADSKVSWRYGRSDDIQPRATEIPGGTQRQWTEVAYTVPSQPTLDQVRTAYRAALDAASGHVVIEPLADGKKTVTIPGPAKPATHEARCATDQNLQALLEAIDEALEQNKRLTAVTIATKNLHFPDEGLAGRIEDLYANRGLPRTGMAQTAD